MNIVSDEFANSPSLLGIQYVRYILFYQQKVWFWDFLLVQLCKHIQGPLIEGTDLCKINMEYLAKIMNVAFDYFSGVSNCISLKQR